MYLEDKIRDSIILHQSNAMKFPVGILMNNKELKEWKREIQRSVAILKLKKKDVLTYMGTKVYGSKEIKRGEIKIF